MTVKIRLARAGARKKPYYRIVIANETAPRDGKFLEKVGNYNPMLPSEDEKRVILLHDRINYWLSVGAKPTERVNKFLVKAKILKEDKNAKPFTKKPPKKKAAEAAASTNS
ncbi:MAG: small subunit ribosomal protein S16 [Candidatus Midichloriaceae bacterium]|jgi:small subunit ribosomal protein S16